MGSINYCQNFQRATSNNSYLMTLVSPASAVSVYQHLESILRNSTHLRISRVISYAEMGVIGLGNDEITIVFLVA